MTAWKPPERISLRVDRWHGFNVCDSRHPHAAHYIAESVALEKQRVLREALEDLVDQVIEYDAYGRQESPDLTKARAALASQGGGA